MHVQIWVCVVCCPTCTQVLPSCPFKVQTAWMTFDLCPCQKWNENTRTCAVYGFTHNTMHLYLQFALSLPPWLSNTAAGPYLDGGARGGGGACLCVKKRRQSNSSGSAPCLELARVESSHFSWSLLNRVWPFSVCCVKPNFTTNVNSRSDQRLRSS